MKELDKSERLGFADVGGAVLLDRITKVGEDEDAELFALQWSKEEGFGCVVQGCSYNLSMVGPRKDWRKTLSWAGEDE
jgi:hypothetical protein